MGGQHLKLLLAPVAWTLLRRSLRLVEFSPPADGASGPQSGPCIFACLHRDILPAIIHVRPARPVLLVSSSPDGEILKRTLGSRDYGFVRGSTGADGGRAFLALRRALAEGRNVGLAVDGPQGPYGVIQDGIFQLARVAGVPIRPLRAEAAWSLHLRTWDRTLIPLPLARVRIRSGAVLQMPRDASADAVESARETLRHFFNDGG